MNIGVVSDTHRNTEYLRKAVDWMVQRRRITGLYHLGDDGEDTAELEDLNLEIVHVPGLYHKQYIDNSLPHKIRENVLGLQVLILHSIEKDLTDEDKMSSDIILHGHTHKHELVLEDGHFIMNPGHLKGPLDKNMPPTFGLLEIKENEVLATIFDLKFGIVQKLAMVRREHGLYKA
jgi:putative phosphoesterase